MASRHHEVEVKLAVSPDGAIPPLTCLPEVASVEGPARHALEAVYFDTADLRLRAAGITLRRRTGGDDQGWHLKIPARKGRHELREPLGRAIRTVPKPLRTMLLATVREERLEPVARICTDRTLYRLHDAEGAVLAEVCDDVVTSEAMRGEAIGRAWREWEVELVAADEELLFAARDLLCEAGAAPAPSSSKLSQALGTAPDPPPTGSPTRSDPAGDVVQARLADLVREMKLLDPLARADVPDGVHQLRVGIRRLHSALATFRPLLDRELSEPLRHELKWAASHLAAPRDAEVVRDRITGLAQAEPAHLDPAELSRHAHEEYEAAHGPAHQQALTALQSARYLGLLDTLDDFAASPPWTTKAELSAEEVLPGRVRHDWKRVKSRMRAVDETEPGSQRENEALHEVRKAARRARYAAETVAPVLGKGKKFGKAMKKLQRALGDHHDSVMTQTRLLETGSRQRGDARVAFGYGRLHAHETERARQARSRYDKRRRLASKKTLRAWMA
jgi:CHAD domain-containing protein